MSTPPATEARRVHRGGRVVILPPREALAAWTGAPHSRPDTGRVPGVTEEGGHHGSTRKARQ